MRWMFAFALCGLVHAADETALIEKARSAAPEFFADTVTRLVERGQIADRQQQIQLLEDAFMAASRAHEPVRVIAIFGTPPESRSTYRSKASELGLDALSLETRVVRAMLAIDPAKARELFGHISHPALEPRPCEDPLVPDASAYYETAAALARSAFSTAEKDTGVHVQFLQTALLSAQSPGELAAFAHAVQSLDLKRAEWDLLLGTLSTKMETIAADYRPFALTIGGFRADLENLAGRVRSGGLGTAGLALSFRTYLVSQLRAPRCSDQFGDSEQAVEWFNSSFRGDLPAISDKETEPSKREGAIKADPYFESDDSKDLGAALTRLQFESEGKPRSTADRSTTEWRELLAGFLLLVADWHPSGDSADVLHQKAYVLRAALELTLPGEDRDRIIEKYVALLESSDAQRQSPAEWLWQVKALVQSASDAPKILSRSSDVGLTLYGFSSGTSK